LEVAGAHLERFDSMSAAIEAFHAGAAPAKPRGDPLSAERKKLLDVLHDAQVNTTRRVHALEQQLAGARDLETLRQSGEAILAYQWQLEPGQRVLEADGLQVALDPEQTPVENAQQYFARYRKARDAAAQLPALLEEARNKAAHLGELAALVQAAASPDEFRTLRREVAGAAGRRLDARPAKPSVRPAQAPQAGGRGAYRRVPLGAGWEALVGASAQGNATITFDVARPHDVWLHARGIPDAHVILRGDGHGEPPPEVLERAAELAAWSSSERAAGSVAVDYVERRHVRKIPGSPPGLVRYEQERTVHVTPRG
jgi:predicted ribosome quality control (RQC) complex YloA/Tae2 family protein